MAAGSDARFLLSKEVTYDTRVVPARAIPINAESLGYAYNRYFSPALGVGRWTRPSIVTTQVGSGSLNGDVPTVGFGYVLDGLNGNTNTPVQQGATTAYLTTFTLDTAVTKSYSAQVQMPAIGSSTLLPHDFTGISLSGITLSWDPGAVLKWEIPTVARSLDTTQSLATYTPPSAWDVLSFKGGTLTIGGVAQTNIVGGGSLTVGFGLRDDAFALGTSGKIAKPEETDKPEASGTFTADFTDNTNLLRVINDTVGDVVLRFEGATIASTYKYALECTIPDCVFTSPRPNVDGPGPVQQEVTFSSASTTNDPPVITYMSTGATL